MKKMVSLSLFLLITSSTVMAQRIITGVRVGTQRFNSLKVKGPERFQLRRDALRLKIVQRNARRDGILTPLEKRRIHKAKSKTCRDVIRLRNNGRHWY